jgi:hypothetical protein
MITPNSFISGDYFESLRMLLNKYCINEIVDFGNKLIFSSANVFTCIFNISKDYPSDIWIMKSDLYNQKSLIKSGSEIYVFKDSIILKLDNFKKFDDYFYIKDVGYNYWSIGRGKIRGKSIGSKVLYKGIKEDPRDTPYLKGSNFNRYVIGEPTQFLRWDHKKYLKENDIFRFSPEFLGISPKLIYRQTSSRLIGMIEVNKYHNDKTVHIIVPKDNLKLNLKYVLGLFNSKLLNYYYSQLINEEGRAFAQVKTVNVKKLPFVFAQENDQEKIISLVDQLIELNFKLKDIRLESARIHLESKIYYLENQINQIVYNLYGLSDDEINTVEGNS